MRIQFKIEKMEGREIADNVMVPSAKARETNKIQASVVNSTDKDTLQGFIQDHLKDRAKVYTDDHTFPPAFRRWGVSNRRGILVVC